jgi:hypothetical protein
MVSAFSIEADLQEGKEVTGGNGGGWSFRWQPTLISSLARNSNPGEDVIRAAVRPRRRLPRKCG